MLKGLDDIYLSHDHDQIYFTIEEPSTIHREESSTYSQTYCGARLDPLLSSFPLPHHHRVLLLLIISNACRTGAASLTQNDDDLMSIGSCCSDRIFDPNGQDF